MENYLDGNTYHLCPLLYNWNYWITAIFSWNGVLHWNLALFPIYSEHARTELARRTGKHTIRISTFCACSWDTSRNNESRPIPFGETILLLCLARDFVCGIHIYRLPDDWWLVRYMVEIRGKKSSHASRVMCFTTVSSRYGRNYAIHWTVCVYVRSSFPREVYGSQWQLNIELSNNRCLLQWRDSPHLLFPFRVIGPSVAYHLN